jgi:hypothetical protein
MAPASRTGLISQGTFQGTRTMGAVRVPLVAAIMACADSIPIGPCSMSKNSQSKPQAARTWVRGTLGIDTSRPTAGRSAARRAFKGLIGPGAAVAFTWFPSEAVYD